MLPDTGIVVLTMYDDDDSVVAALRAGARGYLLKGSAKDELRSAVTVAAQGHSVFASTVATNIVRRATEPRTGPPIQGLTPRELEILTAMADGLGPASIGVSLGISPKTVRNNISAILAKLDVSERSEAVRIAKEAGLGTR